jgi:hypothetical protein
MPYVQFTTSRSVARLPLLQRGCRRFDSSLVDCGRSRSGRHAGTWPRKKPVRVRPVTPSMRGIWRSAGSHTPCARVRSPPPPPWADGATGRVPPSHGGGCGFDSRSVHPPLNADVAQPGEARRSDRRQCRFESDRQYSAEQQLDVAQWERSGFGSRGLGVRVSPSRPMRGSATDTTPGYEPGNPGSNPGLAATRRCSAAESA